MLEKVKIIYKGDIMTSFIYLGIGISFALISLFLYLFTKKVGLYFLSIGLVLFTIYSLAKGILVYKVSKSRYNHYKGKHELSNTELEKELEYTNYRLMKKESNRRRYAWTFVISAIVAVVGVFLKEKGLIIGSMIPIVLFAGVEFAIGLLVEFRLWEFHRMIKKQLGHNDIE